MPTLNKIGYNPRHELALSQSSCLGLFQHSFPYVPPNYIKKTYFDALTSVSRLDKCLVERSLRHVILSSFILKEILGLTTIPVVNKFIDEFNKEVTTLPPEREVKFQIDLILTMRLISITP